MLARIRFDADENIESKVNFFCNYFNLAAIYIGKFPKWDLENPLSIVDKVIFQIENNPEYRTRHLTNHFNNYHFQENGFTNKFKNIKELRLLINQYLNLNEKKKNDWLHKNPGFLVKLKILKLDLEERMFKTAVDFIINYLRCKDNLEKHINDFKYLILIIVSELKFSEKSDREVKSLINKIMSKKVSQFPLPQSIITTQNKKIFDELASEFMANRTFNQQFEGLKNFNDYKDTTGYFILQIHRLKLDQNVELIFDDVKIYNPNNKIFKAFKDGSFDTYGNKHWIEFSEVSNISLAITSGNITNYEAGLKNAIHKVQNTVNYINNKLDTNCFINIYNHRSTPNFKNVGFGFRSDNTKQNLSEYDIEELNKDNPFLRLKAVESQAKVKFLAAEKFYQRALISNEPSDYWHYLECLIPKIMKGDKSEKQVLEVATSLLLINYKYSYPQHLAACILNLLNGNSDIRTDYSLAIHEINKLHNDRKISNIIKIAKNFNHHPIISSLIEDYKIRNVKNKLLRSNEIYYYMFSELYEIRNAYTHSGIKNQYSNKKIKLIIPIYINVIRLFLMKEIENNRVKKIETIINKIKLKAKKILKE